jgi:hypothetical protein
MMAMLVLPRAVGAQFTAEMIRDSPAVSDSAAGAYNSEGFSDIESFDIQTPKWIQEPKSFLGIRLGVPLSAQTRSRMILPYAPSDLQRIGEKEAALDEAKASQEIARIKAVARLQEEKETALYDQGGTAVHDYYDRRRSIVNESTERQIAELKKLERNQKADRAAVSASHVRIESPPDIGVPGMTMRALLVGGNVEGIDLAFKRAYAFHMLDLLVAKYGEPHSECTESYTGAQGEARTATIKSWSGPNARIDFMELGLRADESFVRVQTPRLQASRTGHFDKQKARM